jgi:hypothetical protein
MLPPIKEVALHHGLKMNDRLSKSEKDVRFKCPFCSHKYQKEKYHLSLNIKDNVFKCWSCGESGGVLKFITLLENTSIEEVKARLFGSTPNIQLHPAERLTPGQLKEIGFEPINWSGLRQSNPVLYRNTLSWVWREWQQYARFLKRFGYMSFLAANSPQERQVVCREYAHRLGIDSQSLMMEYVQARFKKPQPEYLKGAEQLLDALKKKGEKVYA